MASRLRQRTEARAETPGVTAYRHGDKRPNIPPAAIAAEGRLPTVPRLTYSYSPHRAPVLRSDPSGKADALPPLLEKATREPLTSEEAALLARALRQHQPWLEWAGKWETPGFAVDPVVLQIHERVSAEAIIRATARQDVERDLFADPKLSYEQTVKFYQHQMDWANRLILGDSLQVMASLAQRENLAGKVQMIYFDPPYGIRFASNFQSEVGDRDVKDGEADLTREPEMIKAYRDTWRLGVHSYLAYLRDRLAAAHTLLTNSGSIFVQISDENLHRVRALLDEVFGAENFVATITVKKTGGQTSNLLPRVADYLLWFARDKEAVHYQPLYATKEVGVGEGSGGRYDSVELNTGERRSLSPAERGDFRSAPEDARAYRLTSLISSGYRPNTTVPFEVFDRTFHPGSTSNWKTTLPGLARLRGADRIEARTKTIEFVRYVDDFAAYPITSVWSDVAGAADKGYVVETSPPVIERCMLMTTKPGDLVLDPTCGGGTTAFVAEQWGRRWITMDTSRVAIALARQRMLTKCLFDYYRFQNPVEGLQGGFACRTLPHVTLRAIAKNEALDAIFALHDPVLDARLAELNAAASAIGTDLRSHLAGKLLAKQRTEGKRAVTDADRRRWDLPKADEGFKHWTVPFDTDPDYTPKLASAVAAYRAAWRTKRDEVDAAVAAAAVATPEELVDQPEIVPNVVRVAGPFTVEAVQPAESSLDDVTHASPIDGAPESLDGTFDAGGGHDGATEARNAEAYLDQMLRLLRLDGVRFPDNRVMRFARLDPLGERSQAIHAEGRWHPAGEADPDPDGPLSVAVAFGPQYGPITAKQVEQLIRAASRRGYDDLVLAGFAFDGAAQAAIEEADHPALRVHMAHIRPDVNPGMNGLLKDTPAAQLFTVFGKPQSTLTGPDGNGEYMVEMEGVDIYDPVRNTVTPSRADKVAAWFVDSDYDGRTFCITQAFFPDKKAWRKLAAALKGVLDETAFAALSGTRSLPFPAGEHRCVAVKVIDPRGNEVMRLHRLDS